MLRILIILSAPPILAAFAGRWWFGIRVLAEGAKETCRADLSKWNPPADGAIMRSGDSAAIHGRRLHDQALAEWKEIAPASAAARENSLRLGLAGPPFAVIIAIFAAIVGKVHVFTSIGLVLIAVALCALVGLLSLPAELHAITRTADRVRKSGVFPSSVDFTHVVRCGYAYAWLRSLPQVLCLLQR